VLFIDGGHGKVALMGMHTLQSLESTKMVAKCTVYTLQGMPMQAQSLMQAQSPMSAISVYINI
jgi:hypothetical protein